MKLRYKFIDLFGGCGGLSLGMENAGFTLYVNELNPDAMDSYLRNRNHKLGGEYFSEIKSLQSSDINLLSPNKLKDLQSEFRNIPEIDYMFDAKKSNSGGEAIFTELLSNSACHYSNIGHRRSYSVDKKVKLFLINYTCE